MRRRHFEALRPVCPLCRSVSNESHRLMLGSVTREEGEHIIEGSLHCTNARCLREYPIVDAV
ncbi:MAG TPA: hypothetical protein VGE52_05175, partial [Pirellulales bacterium]